MILPQASCRGCANITSNVERYCVNNIFNTLRVQRRLPTRRPKNRPSVLPTQFDMGGHLHLHMVAPKQSIAAFAVYRFPPPQIVRLHLPSNSYEYVQERVVSSVANLLHLTTYAVKVSASGAVGTAMRYNPFIFARMLGKIAHGYCIATNALQGFNSLPLLPDIILGKSDNIPYLIGNLGEDEPPIRRATGIKAVHHVRIGTISLQNMRLRVVFIRLFAELPTPTYIVVVGEQSSP
jgi:hypothetical protein